MWTVIRKHVFAIPFPDFGTLGRWVAYLARGRFRHDRIADTPPVRAERLIGWIAHYAIGIAFAGILLAIWGHEWIRDPTIWPTLIVGIGTVAAPFLIMQPATGAGFAGSRTPRPNTTRLQALITHAVFGVGLYIAGWVASRLAYWKAGGSESCCDFGMRTLNLWVFVLLGLVLGGCQSLAYKAYESFGFEKRDLLVKRVSAAREAQSDAREQFSTALDRFRALVDVDAGDLEERYDDLNAEYEHSVARAKEVSERVDAVEAVSEDLFDEWNRELGEYSDPRQVIDLVATQFLDPSF